MEPLVASHSSYPGTSFPLTRPVFPVAMTFLNPLVLFGLVAAAIPLIIHLFNFRRPRRIDFSSLVFLRELQKTTMQRVRIKQWLLLILRTLAIATLVLAFARPTLEGPWAGALGGEARTATVVVLDNSASMQARDDGGVRYEQAAGMAAELADLLKTGDQMAIVTTAGAIEREERWLKTRSAVREAVADEILSFEAADLSTALERAGELVASAPLVNREIFVFSDFQATNVVELVSNEPPVDGVAVRLIPVGTGSLSNGAVEGVNIVSRIIDRNQPLRIQATVAAYGDGGATSNIVSVFLDGERLAQSSVGLEATGRTIVELTVSPKSTGWLSGEVRIEDDDFSLDDRRFFTIHVPERRRVLLVAAPSFDASHLLLALGTRLSAGRVQFDLETISANRLSSVRLTEIDVVIIAGAGNFSTGEIASLRQFVLGGGGLLLFPPASGDLTALNTLLAEMGGGSVEGGIVESGSSGAVLLQQIDAEHPLFEGVFDDSSPDRSGLERTEVFRFARYRPANATELTVMRLSAGDPFLQELRPGGTGRVLFMSSLPEPSWSELPVRGLFVPLLYRSMQYLTSGESVAGDEITIGRSVDVRVPSETGSEALVVRGGDAEFMPRQRRVIGGSLLTIGPEVTRPGILDVFAGEGVLRRLPANVDPVEFDLRLTPPDELVESVKALFSDVSVLNPERNNPGALVSAVGTMRTGVELWNVFLMVALAILLLEMLVARHWRPEAASS